MKKSLLKKQLEADKLEMNLLIQANDVSYRAFGGERQQARGFKKDINTLGQTQFKQPTDIITQEMIKEFQEEQISKPAFIDPTTNDIFQYFPSEIGRAHV